MPRMRPVTAPDLPAATNQRVVSTTTREVQTVPTRTTVDFWPYIEALKPEDWSKHIVYVYRTEPRISMYGSGEGALEKITGFLEVGPGRQIPFNSREEIELGIREKHGGKAFRLILKRGSERIAEEKCSNDYPPRYPHTVPGMDPQSHSVSPFSDASASADVAKVAMSTIAGQERAATETAVRALDAASSVILRMAQGTTPPPPTAMDQTMQAMMVEMMRRAMNPPPPPDPIEQVTKIMALVNTLGGGSGGGGLGPLAPIMNRFLETAAEKVFNPAVAGPTSSAAAELVRQLPGVAGYVTQAIREWRAGVEAQRDTAAMMTGRQPAAHPATAPPAPQPQMQPLPTQLPPTPQPENTMGLPSLEFIEAKIKEILEEGSPVEDAADDALAFLDRMHPELITHLRAGGETELLKLFSTRPTLKPATANMPRLVEFIRAIIRLSEPPKPTAPGTIEGTPQNGQ